MGMNDFAFGGYSKLVLGTLSISLPTVLGLGWICAFFISMQSQEASLTFAYIFVILNGSQVGFSSFSKQPNLHMPLNVS